MLRGHGRSQTLVRCFSAPFRLTPSATVVLAAMAWWHSLRFRWQTWDKGHVVFVLACIVPIAAVAGMARFAFVDHMESQAARQRHADITCLAENIYYEARGEPLVGQYAVAEVTLNRVASRNFPRRFARSFTRSLGIGCANVTSARSPGRRSRTDAGRAGAAWQRALHGSDRGLRQGSDAGRRRSVVLPRVLHGAVLGGDEAPGRADRHAHLL